MRRRDERRGSPVSPTRATAAAGSLRVLEPQITASRRLDYYTYFLLVDGQAAFESHWTSLEELSRMGFKVNPHRQLCRNVEEVLGFWRRVGRRGARNCHTKSMAWW